MKNKYIIKSVEQLLQTTTFKIIMLFIIIMTIFVVQNYRVYSVFESIIAVLTNNIYLSLGILPVFLFVALLVRNNFDHNIYLLLRLNNKNNYFRELIKNIVAVTSILYGILLILIIIFENVFNAYGYSVDIIDKLGTYNVLYMFYVAIRLYVFLIIYSLINVMLIKTMNDKIVIILNLVFCSVLFFSGYQLYESNVFLDVLPKIENILVNNIIYKNIWLNLLSTSLTFVLLVSGFIVTFLLAKKTMKDVIL